MTFRPSWYDYCNRSRRMAQEIGNLPEDFDPATWLKETGADLTIAATEAVRELVYEALELGLGWCL